MTVPYTTPPTAVPGQTLSAANWNTKVRDSLESVGNPPRVAVTRATVQSVGNASVSSVVWTAETYDTDNFWTAGGAANRLTIPAGLGGVYLVTFSPIFNINATGARYAAVMKNGLGAGSPANSGGFAGWYVQLCVTAVVVCVPGDYFEGAVYQSSGAALDLKGDVYNLTMTATRIGAA